MSRRSIVTLAIASVAIFMVTLDNLVVTTALPSIRARPRRLARGPGVDGQRATRWRSRSSCSPAPRSATASAAGAMFVIGIAIFTVASAVAALAPSTDALIAARAIQGARRGDRRAAHADAAERRRSPPSKRGLALGIWSGIGGLGVALGPLVGGAIVDGISWQWIFWVNVPIGLALAAARRAAASPRATAPPAGSTSRGVALASAGLLGVVYGIVRGNALGWTSTTDRRLAIAGAALLVAFVPWERARAGADAAAALLPLARLRGHQRRVAGDVLRRSSARSSCSRSSSRPCRATARSRPACARCPGPACRCSSPRSPARSRTASARGR